MSDNIPIREDDERDKDENDEPFADSECPKQDEGGIECEFENRDGSWWCTTHNCWA